MHEYNGQGFLNISYAYVGDERVGQLEANYNHTSMYTEWRFADPVTGDELMSGSNGNGNWPVILDPNGVDAGVVDPFPLDGSGNDLGGEVDTNAKLRGVEGAGQCLINGIELMPCSFVSSESTIPLQRSSVIEHGKPSTPPTLKPYNDPRQPYRPFDPNIEQPIHSGVDALYLNLLFSSFTGPAVVNPPSEPLPQNPGQNPEMGIEELLKKPTCSAFLNGMLVVLGIVYGRGREGVSFEDLFHAIPTGAYRFNPNNKTIANASPDGILIGNPQFTITYKFANDYVLPYTLIHEIIHGSPREAKNYTHFAMADAAW